MGEENSVLLVHMLAVRCGLGFEGDMLQLTIDETNLLDRNAVIVTGDWRIKIQSRR